MRWKSPLKSILTNAAMRQPVLSRVWLGDAACMEEDAVRSSVAQWEYYMRKSHLERTVVQAKACSVCGYREVGLHT